MSNVLRATAVATGLVAAAMGSAGLASAAATSPVNAATAIHAMQAEGYRVILDEVGDEPLSLCHVTSARPGKPVTEAVTVGGGDTVQKVFYTPIYVDVAP